MLEALKRLEYRGYDSAGIATLHDGQLARRRAVGKLIALSDLLVQDPIRGHAGIGHTRWATHGAPTERNAHPHQAGRVAVVHNGIIENYRALRAELEAEGAVFETETDTETVVQLCDRELAAGLSPLEAARATLARLEGAFALCFLFDGEEDLLIAARRGSPLAVGYGKGEAFVGSDALALAPMTSRIAYLEEGDHAVLTRDARRIFDAEGRPGARRSTTSRSRTTSPGRALTATSWRRRCTSSRRWCATRSTATHPGRRRSRLPTPRLPRLRPPDPRRLRQRLAGHVAKYWIERFARLPVDTEVASEFRYRNPPLPPGRPRPPGQPDRRDRRYHRGAALRRGAGRALVRW